MPEITEAKLYEAFGLEAPAEPAGEGAQAQEPAAPAAEDPSASAKEGAQVQEPAEPAAADDTLEPNGRSEPTAANAEPVTTDDDADPGHGEKKEPLTPEQRKANAARRRQQEQQAAIDQAVSEALQAERQKIDTDLKAFFERMGAQNTYTGEPITTMDQFYEWKNKYDMEQLDKDLKSGNATAEQLSQMIANHPDVKRAQQVVQQSQQAQVQQRNAADQARIDNELAEIAKLDPTIKGVGDLLVMPKAAQFREYVDKGYSFLDAYKLSHNEELIYRIRLLSRQEALNDLRGKDHLQATGGARGSGAVAVTPAEMRMYRAFNPNATDAEIQAFHNKQKKS